MARTGTKPEILTEAQRLLFSHEDWSYTWLAERLGLTRITVANWLRGKQKCPRRRQAQIAHFLEAGPIRLFDEDGFAVKVRS